MITAEKIKVIDEIFNRYYAEFNFSGVGLLKSHDEIVYTEAFGYAHKGWGIKNKVDTRFDTASITKLFTATAILKIIDEGGISLDDRILDIVDVGKTSLSDEVTIYHLLTHTSGIGDDADEEAGEEYEDLFVNNPNYSIRRTSDFLPQFKNKPKNFDPGESCRYNNVAYVLLGLAIEKVTGQSYREYVSENIFHALNMNDTAFLSMDGINENCAEGYKRTEDGKWAKNIYSYPPIGSPDGGAFTTVFDLEKFIQGVKSEDFLSRELTEALLTPKVLYNQYEEFKEMMGFGFEFRVDEDDNVLSINKDGVNAGVAGILDHSPRENQTLIILANQDCNVWKLLAEIRGIIE